MKLINNWSKKTLICIDCKTTKSVKYLDDGKTYCNLCMAKKEN